MRSGTRGNSQTRGSVHSLHLARSASTLYRYSPRSLGLEPTLLR